MWAIMRATSIASCVEDRVPRDLGERDVLGRQPGGRADQDRALDLGRVVERPLQDLHAAERAADRRVDARDAERAQQRAVHLGEVADGEQREVEPVRLAGRGVDRRRPGRPLAPAEQVRADDVEAVGVDRLARADQRVPPDRRLGVAGQRVADVDDRERRRRRSARTRSRAARSPRRTRASDRLAGRASQPRVRREEMTPVSNPARCSPPWKRACSIFTQRLETTSRPAAMRDLHRLVAVQPELHPERAGARVDRLAARRPAAGRRAGRRRRGRAAPAARPATGSTARRGSSDSFGVTGHTS